MKRVNVVWITAVALAFLMLGCAPVGGGRGTDTSPSTDLGRATRKRIVAAIMSDPPAVDPSVTPGAGLPGQGALHSLVHAGLTSRDDEGQLRPGLAEAVPSVENGLWKVSPDGRMETVWNIRRNALWHDGVPVTAEDILFASVVQRDRDLPLAPNLAYDAVEGIEATDLYTLVVQWKRPYIDADTFTSPLPKHLLERRYREEKVGFVQLPYWSQEFVGTGPYKLRAWVPGSHVVLDAHDRYVLGRPKIDEIEVRFLADPTTLAANLLAGAVDVTLGKSLSLDQAIQVQDKWQSGRIEMAASNSILIYPQLLNTSPAVVADARFRRALMHGTDRQQLVDTIMYGRALVAESFFSPSSPEYQATRDAVVRYAYDPSLAVRMIEALGYVKGSDGLFKDAQGQELAVEIRTNQVDTNIKALLVVADQWKQLGVKVDPVPMSPQSQTDGAYVTTFPSFLLYRQPSDLSGLKRHHRAQTPLPENSFRGGNYSRYQDPGFSDLIDRVFMTVPRGERIELLRQIVHRVSDQLIRMGLFYDVQATMIVNQLRGVPPSNNSAGEVWNAHEWEVRN